MALRSALINVMVGAAQKAARHLVRDFGEVENLQVSRKGPADFVSVADKKAESVIVAELQRSRPHYGFLLEERGAVEGRDNSNRWIVDPLDGTTNFLHGIPHFAISIALERDRDLFAGVVYDPIGDQLYWAEKGNGAFLNGRRLRVSSRRSMDEALFATGIPFKGTKNHALFLRQLENVMARSAGVRRFGAVSLDLAYVASGRYEGYWETGIHPWDMGAGVVLVREAGGFVTDLKGKNDFLKNGEVLAASPDLHDQLAQVLKSAVASAV